MKKLTQLVMVFGFVLLLGTIALAENGIKMPVSGGPLGGSNPPSKAATLTTVLAGDLKFYNGSKGSVIYPDPLMKLKQLVTDDTRKTVAYKKSYELRIKELAKSVKAVEDPNNAKRSTYYRHRMTPKRRIMIAKAALYAEERTGVDATFLVALARMESDFRGLVMINSACKHGRSNRCWADCGMTQHHVRGGRRYVFSKCNQLKKDHKLAFLKSAQEISRHIVWCTTPVHAKYHRPIRRCILNRYNMGPFYKTASRCKRQYNCGAIYNRTDMSKEEKNTVYSRCRPKHRKCRGRAAYWQMVSCFEYGARRQIQSKRNCRYCYNISQIKRRFYKDITVPAKITTDTKVSSAPVPPKSTNKTTN